MSAQHLLRATRRDDSERDNSGQPLVALRVTREPTAIFREAVTYVLWFQMAVL